MSHVLLDSPISPDRAPESVPRRAAWGALVVLTLINLLNYIDRFVVPPLDESLRRSTLHVSDTQFGLLATAFLWVYLLSAPLLGRLGDRRARPPIIAIGVACWSVATALGGLAVSFASLAAARAAVGIGEAAYSAIAPALLAEYFPERLRGRVFAIFFAATPVGAALGYIIGGVVNHAVGWRAVFFVAGGPGLLLALAALALPEPRGDVAAPLARGSGAGGPRPFAAVRAAVADAWRTYASLARMRLYVLTVLGYAAYTFAIGGISHWMPTFLERVRGVPEAEASTRLGVVLLATGIVGTVAGGWIGDRAMRRTARGNLWVCAASSLLALPAAWIALTSARPAVYWSAIAIAELLVFLATGPVNSAIVGEVPIAVRASAMAGSIFVIHALGDGISPPIIGVISDAGSLSHAVLIIPAALLASGIIWLNAARRRTAA